MKVRYRHEKTTCPHRGTNGLDGLGCVRTTCGRLAGRRMIRVRRRLRGLSRIDGPHEWRGVDDRRTVRLLRPGQHSLAHRLLAVGFVGSASSGYLHLAIVLALHSWLRQRLRYWRLGSITRNQGPAECDAMYVQGTRAEGVKERHNTGTEMAACLANPQSLPRVSARQGHTACGRWRWFPHVSRQRRIK